MFKRMFPCLVAALAVSVLEARAHDYPCTFSIATTPKLCAHIVPDPNHFKEISVDVTKPGAKIAIYYWKENTQTLLGASDLRAMGYEALVQVGMYYMFTRGQGSSGSTCAVAGATAGEWSGTQFFTRVPGQAGIYYIATKLRGLRGGSILEMTRSRSNDAEKEKFLDFLETWDTKNEVDVDFLPIEYFHYFGVPVPTSQKSSVSLQMVK